MIQAAENIKNVMYLFPTCEQGLLLPSDPLPWGEQDGGQRQKVGSLYTYSKQENVISPFHSPNSWEMRGITVYEFRIAVHAVVGGYCFMLSKKD